MKNILFPAMNVTYLWLFCRVLVLKLSVRPRVGLYSCFDWSRDWIILLGCRAGDSWGPVLRP